MYAIQLVLPARLATYDKETTKFC